MFYTDCTARSKSGENELRIKKSSGLVWLDCTVHERNKLQGRLEKWVGVTSHWNA